MSEGTASVGDCMDDGGLLTGGFSTPCVGAEAGAPLAGGFSAGAWDGDPALGAGFGCGLSAGGFWVGGVVGGVGETGALGTSGAPGFAGSGFADSDPPSNGSCLITPESTVCPARLTVWK